MKEILNQPARAEAHSGGVQDDNGRGWDDEGIVLDPAIARLRTIINCGWILNLVKSLPSTRFRDDDKGNHLLPHKPATQFPKELVEPLSPREGFL